MINISVIASPELLLLLGLFLITCPAEGYVAGWSDCLDWSNQGMARSPGKRQNDLTPNEQEKDGTLVFQPKENAETPSNYPIYPSNAAPPQDSKDVQNNEINSTDGDLPNGQQNNGDYGTTFDNAVVYILPIP